MKRLLSLGLLALLAAGCGDEDGAADGGADAGTTGAIEVSGNWNGAQPAGVTFDVAVFACPFSMPPAYYSGDGTIDAATGDVHAVIADVGPGEWCLMAYVDMIPDDGLAPVDGTDAVNATGLENANGAIPVEVVAGETTSVELTFAVQ